MISRMVVLPTPLPPMRAIRRPGDSRKVTSRNNVRAPWDFVRPETVSTGSGYWRTEVGRGGTIENHGHGADNVLPRQSTPGSTVGSGRRVVAGQPHLIVIPFPDTLDHQQPTLTGRIELRGMTGHSKPTRVWVPTAGMDEYELPIVKGRLHRVARDPDTATTADDPGQTLADGPNGGRVEDHGLTLSTGIEGTGGSGEHGRAGRRQVGAEPFRGVRPWRRVTHRPAPPATAGDGADGRISSPRTRECRDPWWPRRCCGCSRSWPLAHWPPRG